MIYLLALLILIPFILQVIWNVISGKGINAPIGLPPKGSKWRQPIRAVLCIDLALILYFIIQMKIEDGRQLGKSDGDINISIILYIVATIIAVVVFYLRFKNNHKD
jgi:hypothetical protein